MSTTTREFSWLSWLSQADPDWVKESQTVIEYEFTARGLSLEPDGDHSEFEGGMRVFRGRYRDRGAYAEDDE